VPVLATPSTASRSSLALLSERGRVVVVLRLVKEKCITLLLLHYHGGNQETPRGVRSGTGERGSEGACLPASCLPLVCSSHHRANFSLYPIFFLPHASAPSHCMSDHRIAELSAQLRFE
jgi:hypothetical protein